jgi:IMP cyclohydrolase
MGDKTYVGRFVAVGRTTKDDILAGYRVSSRSFGNRKIIRNGDTCSVVPANADEYRDNPYISYNCLRRHNDIVVVSNGSQTDPIIEKIGLGYPMRDALAASLLTLDFEKDKYDTPRIACVADWGKQSAAIAIVMPDKLEVRGIEMKPGKAYLIATYELTDPTQFEIKAGGLNEFADELYGMEFTYPVCSLAARICQGKLETAIHNPSGT